MEPQASSSTLTPGLFDSFNSQLQANALKATRSALALPTDVAFHRSMDPAFSKDLDAFSARVLSLTNDLLNLVATADTAHSVRGKGKAKLESQDDVIDRFHSLIVDPMDQLLERTDMCLDEYTGRTKPPAIAVNLVSQNPRKIQIAPRGHLDPALQHASYLQKPQLSFKRKPDNTESPWLFTLSHKYNAQVPLGYDFRDTSTDATSSNLMTTHPYHYEITHISYPPRLFQNSTPAPPKSFDETPFTWVANTQDLHDMLSKLRKATEIAVDLEHHSYRSFAGFLCLMQISTREEDFIVDTLVLREELVDLNEIFTDPLIVKVFHGADSDIVWLQQDFNIYVVNLFDTYHASKLLEFPRHGLANLLEMYCDFTPDKRYQLADWRIRPLPQEMLQYARSDTHFLLYIYDNLRNALLDRASSRAQSRAQSISPSSSPPHPLSFSVDPSHALIKQVLSRSEETSLRTYEKETYDLEDGTGGNGWDTLARKWNKGALIAGGPGVGVGALQRAVYKAVHRWRDSVAREDDESTRYVLPNHFLFQLAEQPPADMAALLKAFRSVPPVIRRRAKELLDVIREALKRHLVPTNEEPALGPAIKTPIPYEVSIEANPAPDTTSPDLWSRAEPKSMTTSLSSLFGSVLSPARDPRSVASKSFLFGNTIRGTKFSSSSNAHFQELVARINSTLVIMPSAPQLVKQVSQETEALTDNITIPDPVLGMETEIPFIPASQRKPTDIIEDSLVVVGQARQKKRKRAKPAPDGTEAPSAEGSTLKKTRQDQHKDNGDGAEDEKEPFDFSVVPNILDDNPNLEDTKKKRKQKKQKNSGVFYGDFPAPPKAYSELKRGNQSHTFK